MAELRGKGSATDREVFGRYFDNGMTKDGKTIWVDFQLRGEALKKEDPQTDLHLVTQMKPKRDKAGKEVLNEKGEVVYGFDNGAPYSKDQVDKCIKAAGDNVVKTKDGTVFALKASLMPQSKGHGLVVNTNKPMSPSDYPLDMETLYQNQKVAVEEGRAYIEEHPELDPKARREAARAAKKAAQAAKEAPEAGKEAAVEAAQEEPNF